ncbi:MAG: BatC protein [Dermatophilaceae bacterium]
MTQTPMEDPSTGESADGLDAGGSGELGGSTLSDSGFGGETEGPADSGADDDVTPGHEDGGADGGAGSSSGLEDDTEGPADSGADDDVTPGHHDGGADGGADASQ